MKLLLTALCLSTFSFAAQAKILKCSGTEPFWGAKINTITGMTKLSDAGGDLNATVRAKITQAAGTASGYAFTAQSKYVTLAVMENSTCSDGMSDNVYTHGVLLIRSGHAPLVGCCK